MAIVIKEIRVQTVVEKKVITEADLSEDMCRKIRKQILEELSVPLLKQSDSHRKKER